MCLPHVEIPEFALPEGDVVAGVGQELEQDDQLHPAWSSLEDCPEHSHQEVPAAPGETLLLLHRLHLGLLRSSSLGLDRSQHDQQGERGQQYLDPETTRK